MDFKACHVSILKNSFKNNIVFFCDYSDIFVAVLLSVIPAKAGIQPYVGMLWNALDSRFRGNDRGREIKPEQLP